MKILNPCLRFPFSLFSDFQTERNVLVRHAYPVLQEYAATLGLDFQIVDMRWGVTDESVSEHLTEELCLREIANCQRLSFGPNFVVCYLFIYTVEPHYWEHRCDRGEWSD